MNNQKFDSNYSSSNFALDLLSLTNLRSLDLRGSSVKDTIQIVGNTIFFMCSVFIKIFIQKLYIYKFIFQKLVLGVAMRHPNLNELCLAAANGELSLHLTPIVEQTLLENGW